MTLPGLFVGIDLGGTNVRVGLIDRGGALLGQREAPIEAARGPHYGIARITALIEAALKEAGRSDLGGIGIGSTGPVDRERGAIQNPYTLPTWEDVDIVAPLARRFGVPVAIENDADAAALGEFWQGAGRGAGRLFMVTVGTGIGTGCLIDGAVYRGRHGAHGEGGHQVLDPSGPECYCGARGCWESLASGPAIARQAQARAAEHPSALREMCGGDMIRIDARMVTEAARQGDAVARAVIERAALYLGLGLVNVITFFVPEVIVLGGSVMRSYDLLAPVMEATVRQHDKMVPAAQVRLVPAALGGQAGVCGAAYAAIKMVEQTSP